MNVPPGGIFAGRGVGLGSASPASFQQRSQSYLIHLVTGGRAATGNFWLQVHFHSPVAGREFGHCFSYLGKTFFKLPYPRVGK